LRRRARALLWEFAPLGAPQSTRELGFSIIRRLFLRFFTPHKWKKIENIDKKSNTGKKQ
jgi:hypothetical protein